MSRFIVYGLADPRDDGEIRYVGASTQGMKRPLSHLTQAATAGTGWRARWLRQLWEARVAPKVLILEELELADGLAAAEQRWIAEFRAMGFRLTNLTDGGDGIPGHRMTPADAQRRRAAMARFRAKLEADELGRRLHYQRRSERFWGQRRIAEGKPWIADQHGNRWPTEELAAHALGVEKRTVLRALTGKQAHVLGRQLRYVA